ncbi:MULTISPECIES: phosphoglucosamine mutase [unclassified Anaerobiospirillum]|uniref:phosphoglucosamine mutase n=1 Tax=unclassified Anaerobiospirillum TaxID=2647410 RepID=UPI001FF213AE|nr:phosphoglucosamine mutase [Anaerobiospirillum sp. NML120449]MCK0534064.1 phosphoglucosamine mutase [Anaerobiospirillum sp. NML120511]MCK0539193.1 phosphoglucosamine mutase [Anaerobiospirillum sp. NML02-A-032]
MKRKYFGTDGVRGRVGQFPITPDFVMKLGMAAGKVLLKNDQGRVIIGKDTRLSGYMLEAALEAGFSASGVSTVLLGPMPTPAVSYLTRAFRADLGVVISASHNPFYDNGIKFFSSEGTKLPDEVESAIEEALEHEVQMAEPASFGRAYRQNDAPGRYVEFCKSTFDTHMNLDGLNIVLDCANGATYHVAPLVFRELGANVHCIGISPDGININDGVGSTHIGHLAEKVLAQKADLGIAFDGDGDRVMMVDRHGRILDGDALLYIIARERAIRGRMMGGVVGTQMSNLGFELALKRHGIDFTRTAVGDRYVMEELIKRSWRLGGENSGHIICLDYTSTGDGIISALQVLKACIRQGRTLDEMCDDLVMFPQELINIRLSTSFDALNDDKVKAEVRAVEEVLKDKGRVLLRKSGTEPLIRVMVEGEDSTEVHNMAVRIADCIRAQTES